MRPQRCAVIPKRPNLCSCGLQCLVEGVEGPRGTTHPAPYPNFSHNRSSYSEYCVTSAGSSVTRKFSWFSRVAERVQL
jgi:hypothetical protein